VVLPGTISKGYYSWENRGDAHFYAKCAEHYSKTGVWKWFEIYPIALKKGFKTEMQWSAIGTPLAIYTLHNVSGLDFKKSAVWLSALSYILSLTLIYCIFSYCAQWRLGIIAVFLALMLEKMAAFSFSAGTESFSQASLLLCMFFTIIYIKSPNPKTLLLLCVFSILGCFIRPHNQFFLFALGPCLFFSSCKHKKQVLLFWIASLLLIYGISKYLHDSSRLSFPYLFSFLVGSDKYPGHDIFKLYTNGFGFSDLWAEKEHAFNKLNTGYIVLKMYWTGWLPSLIIVITTSFIGPFKALSRISSLILLAGIFFASTGHLVPRYWTITEPFILLALLLPISPYFKRHWLHIPLIAALAFIVIPIHLKNSAFQKSKISNSVPQKVSTFLNEQTGLVACSKPSLIIDALSKEILLLPKNCDVVNKINDEITQISTIVFCPGWEQTENKNWHDERLKLQKMGYSLYTQHKHPKWLIYTK